MSWKCDVTLMVAVLCAATGSSEKHGPSEDLPFQAATDQLKTDLSVAAHNPV